MRPLQRRPRARSWLVTGVAVSAVVMSLAAGAPAAQALPGPGPSGPGRQAAAHYTPAPCNRAQNSKPGQVFAQCFTIVRTALDHQITASPNQPPVGALGPADIQGAYHLPATGQGQTVAIVDAFGDSHAEADLAAFRSYYGLPPCTTANGCFKKVDQAGGTNYPPDDNGWGLETSLDLAAVSSACPNCHILLVEANDNTVQNLGPAVNEAVAMGAKYVSNSYGAPGEFSAETSYDHYYNHPGVAVTAASGDFGYGQQGWPASNPNVVGVGGTTLTKDTSAARGWGETAWAGSSSGCSPYEPHPDYQNGVSTNCPGNKAIADISADADPNTGLGIYDTLGYGGWLQAGGTSLASPLIASMYALAGTPAPGTYPVTYPYHDPNQAKDLFDITQGSNGSCGNLLCNAGPGWDGPTGLGTPDGVKALAGAPQGVMTGKVTDATTGKPVAGAAVSASPGNYQTTTDASGDYTLNVSVGSYDVTASLYGYKTATRTGVQVSQGQTTTANFTLAAVPSRTLSGTITDGSGHGWPLYAKITIDGYPNGAIYTNPDTGRYSVNLPGQNTYTLHVTPLYPGYQAKPVTVTVTVGSSNVRRDVTVPVNATTCTAPGYTYKTHGIFETFDKWSGKTPQDGWMVTDNINSGSTWEFDNPDGVGNSTGGTGNFAVAFPYATGGSQDTSLVSPVVNLSGQAHPTIAFDSHFLSAGGAVADVDLSVDGGHTWTTVWHQTTTGGVPGHVNIPIPQAAGQSSVQARFHYTYTAGQGAPWFWEVNNALIGNRTCDPVAGGLVDGLVTDDNTGSPVERATVASPDNPGQVGISAPAPGDPNLSGGFYWLFSSLTGSHKFTASFGNYTPSTVAVTVAADQVTRKDWALRAGHLTVAPGSLAVSEALGQAKTATVTLRNNGTEPVHVKISQDSNGFTPAYGQSAASWTPIADYPTPIAQNAVAYNNLDGKVYSVGGDTGSIVTPGGYVYNPAAQQWNPIAHTPQTLFGSAAAFIDGTMYVVGGWAIGGSGTDKLATLYAYHPSSNNWTRLADLPETIVAAGVVVLDSKLYVIGGCTFHGCSPASALVYRYDPPANSWTQLADYPTPMAYGACAGIVGEIVCAGGASQTDTAPRTILKATYIYHPGSDTWTRGADMPYYNWAMASSGASNKLQVVTGKDKIGNVISRAAEYDPARNTWSALPAASYGEYLAGGSCGMYLIGGYGGTTLSPQSVAQVLPGYDQCNGVPNVPWLSKNASDLNLAPGQSATVTVTMNSSAVPQPGDYAALLSLGTDTPYYVQPVAATMHVAPPKTWGKITGTVTAAATGRPIAAATVQITTNSKVGYTLKTDQNGHYQLWLNARYSPLQIIAAKDLYQQQVQTAKIIPGRTTTANFSLKGS